MEKTTPKHKAEAKHLDTFLAGLLIGSLAGAVTMLLFAPQSGQDTRLQIQETAIELRDQTEAAVEGSMAKIRTRAGQIKTEVTDKARELKQQGQDVLVEQLGRVSAAAENGQLAIQGKSD
jgi:gas vesicle protein